MSDRKPGAMSSAAGEQDADAVGHLATRALPGRELLLEPGPHLAALPA